MYNAPDTAGKNTFTGTFSEGINQAGIALLKTTWGDSLLWARKVYLQGSSFNSFSGPQGTVICSGTWGPPNTQELLISKFDAGGVVQWVKRFRFNPIHLKYYAGSYFVKNISVTDNAIYFNAVFNGFNNVIGKLDLNGNIIWTKSFVAFNTRAIDAPFYQNNSVFFLTHIYDSPLPGSPARLYYVLTKLNDIDGSVVESNSFKTAFDTSGVFPFLFKANSDNSFSVSGFMGIADGSGNFGLTDIVFNSKVDINLNNLFSYYYNNQLFLDAQESYFDFNSLSQNAILSTDVYKPLDKYFITFEQNGNIHRSRKFITPTINSGIYHTSVNLDDKLNLHFINHYPQTGKIITEYARISNFAPDGTLSCFGKDTSIFTRNFFDFVKQPYPLGNLLNDVLISNDVPYTEDTAIVTKELICKIVSYCDSIHIKGPAIGCVGQPLRYTVAKNNGCFKNLDWLIDTAVATIISAEGDSAITISFKQVFNGYIHSALTDCVIKDSFKVNIVESPLVKILNRDSLLCPGKTIVLNTSAGFNPYLWQDGSNTQNYTVSTIGFYKITATSFCAVQSSDSIAISLADTSLVITPTQTICKYDTAFISLPPDAINITWQPNNNVALNNKTLALYPLQNTIYTITAERLANCPVSRTSEVLVKNCAKYIFVPNAFSPNNDGVNDVFRAIPVRSPESFLLTIYNRYGQKLFETTDPSSGWDGNYGGKPQPAGGYAYHCSYRFAGDLERAESGYFILIR